MDIRKLFNATATIYLYHTSDSSQKKEAEWALRSIQMFRKIKEEQIPSTWLNAESIDSISSEEVAAAYNALYEKIVMSRFPYLIPAIDECGRKYFKAPFSKHMTGNRSGAYQFYPNYDTLEKRLGRLNQIMSIAML